MKLTYFVLALGLFAPQMHATACDDSLFEGATITQYVSILHNPEYADLAKIFENHLKDRLQDVMTDAQINRVMFALKNRTNVEVVLVNGKYSDGPFIGTVAGPVSFEDFVDELRLASLPGANTDQGFASTDIVSGIINGRTPPAQIPVLSLTPSGNSVTPMSPGLSGYDNVRDEDGQYEAYYGKWKRDDE